MSWHQSTVVKCLKKQKGSVGFTICFPQGLKLQTAVEEVLKFFCSSDLVTIIYIKPDEFEIFLGTGPDISLHDEKEVDLDTVTSCQSGIFLSTKGKLFVLPENHEGDIPKITGFILNQQEQNYFKIKFEDLTKAASDCDYDLKLDTIRRKSFRASCYYNATHCSQSQWYGADRQQDKDQEISLKRKHLESPDKEGTTETTLKRKRSGFGLVVYQSKFSNKKCKKTLKSTVKKETIQCKPKYARKYTPSARKGIVPEDNSHLTAVSAKRISPSTQRFGSSKHQKKILKASLNKFFTKKKSYTVFDDKCKIVKSHEKENDLSILSSSKKRQEDDHDDHSAWLRERTDLPFSRCLRYHQEILVYPNRRKKPSSSATVRGHSTDRPVEASGRETTLPPRENIVTSTISIYRQSHFVQYPPPTTNSMSFASEQALALRLHGMANRRHGRAPPPARHPQYADAGNRRSSFNQWPTNTRQDPTSMANYGFFYTGRVDLVRCFQCGIGLKDWSEPDEPLFEHIKHSPECSFLLQVLGPELLAAYKVNLVPGSSQPAAARPPPVEGPNDGESRGATGGASATPSIRSPQHAELSARLRSFNNFNRAVTQTPLELAEAGFYYTGDGDVCRCFTCDGGLTRWDPQDDPWVEHAKWFPQCTFVRQIKGDEYVNLIQQAIASTDDENSTGGARATATRGLATLSIDTPSNPLGTPAAQTALEMGYSRKAVILAIHELNAKNKQTYKAEDIVGILTGKQDRGEALPTDTPPNEPSGAEGSQSDEQQVLEQDNKRLKTILKCIRCDDRLANMLFIPCTHHKLCQECAQDVTMCPVCGRNIEEKIRTYMS